MTSDILNKTCVCLNVPCPYRYLDYYCADKIGNVMRRPCEREEEDKKEKI